MIVVFGSLNMDLVMRVGRLARAGETVLAPGYETKPGGKGNNQAVAAARAGAQVAMVGSVGDDGFGRALAANLEREGIDTRHLAVVDRPTGIAAITVDAAGENSIVVASGANLATHAAQLPDALVTRGATLVAQMEVAPAETFAAIDRAARAGARVVLNVAPAAAIPAHVLEGVSVLVVNELEAVAVGRPLVLQRDAIESLALDLAREAGLACVVTLGGRGALAVAADGMAWHVEPLAITPVDTTGAGDAFTGILAASLDAGHDLPAALGRANAGAGLACLAVGAQEALPMASAIDARLSQAPAPKQI